MSRRIIAASLFTVTAAFILVRLVAAVPPQPMNTYGTVKLDGENVAIGTTINAYCDGVVYGSTTVTDDPPGSGNSVYVITVLGDDSSTPGTKEGCLPGDTVSYNIGYPDGAILANETATWSSGSNVELNLTGEKPRPELTLVKLVNEQDVGSAPGPFVEVGQPVTWTYTISNTGNVLLTDVVLTDNNGTPANPVDDITVCTYASLSPLAAEVCQLADTAVAGQYSNQATVWGVFTQTVSAADSSYYFGAIVAVDLEKATNGQDADTAPGVYVAAGDVITWTYAIDNVGNVSLADLEIIDDNGTPANPADDFSVCTVANLTPADAPVSCTVSGGAAASGQYGNVARVSGTAPNGLPAAEDSDASHYYGAETAISLAKKTNSDDADAPPGPYVLVGSSVSWDYTVLNDSNVQLSNIQVSDNLVATIDCAGINQLAPGAQMTCTATGMAIEGQYMNIGQVMGTPPGGLAVVSDTNPSHYFGANPQIQIEKYTNDQDADQPPGVYIEVGQPLTWTYVVSNTGNVDLTNVEVVDDNGTPGVPGDDFLICTIANLLPGDPPVSCSLGSTAELGQYGNLGTATATPIGGLGPITDTDPSHYVGARTGVTIEKLTNGEDADTAPGPYIPVVPEPAPIVWTYVITNSGTITLTNIQVTDDQPGVEVQCPAISELGAGEAMTCQAVGAAVEGQYANVGTVLATPIGGLAVVSDTDVSHYFGARPVVTLEKSTNGQDADTATGPFILVGNNVTWTYAITNSGNVTITVNTLVDDQGESLNCLLPAELGPGQGITCEAYGQAAVGQYANLATVQATPIGGLAPISDSDPSHYYGANPMIAVQKYTNGQDADSETGPYVPVGEPVLWTYVVSNTGNVTLQNVVLVDDNGTPGDPADDYECLLGVLAPGVKDTLTCQQSLAGGAVAGQQSNLATVTGQYASVSAQASDPSHYFGALSGIDLEKHTNGVDADTSPGPYILVGDSVTWSYVVTNTGNVRLVNVTITDDGGTPGNPADDYSCNFAELLPGIPKSCQDTDLAHSGQYANQATAAGTPPGGLALVQDVDVSHYFGSITQIDLEKYTNGVDVSATPGPYILNGDLVTWTYAITNTGNVTLTLLSVTDDQGVSIECPALSVLGPNEAVVCQALGIAVSGQYTNLGTVVASPPGGLANVEDSDASYYFGAEPAIALKKLTNGQDADNGPGPYILVGDDVVWTFVITNTGNVTLTNIFVTDDNGTPDFEGDDIVSEDQGPLAAQDSTTYTLAGQAEAGPYTNVGSVKAKPLIGNDVADSSSSSYFGTILELDIEKYTNGEDADVVPGPTIFAGDPVTWTYVVSNTSNVTLVDVVVSDDNGTPEDPTDDFEVCTVASLAPNEAAALCMFEGLALPGQYGNQGIAVGTAPGDLDQAIGQDLSHYFGFVPAPALRMEKYVNGRDADLPPGPYLRSGQSVTWTYTVYNIGNVTLSDLVVVDDNGTPGDPADDFEVCSRAEMAPSATPWVCQHTGQAMEGPYVNLAEARALYVEEGSTISDTDAAHYFGVTVSLSIEKLTNGVDADDPPGISLEPGDAITWTYIVSNSSNIMLTHVVVWDDNGTAGTPGDDFAVCTIGDLAPGQEVLCQHHGLATVGPYGNIGTVVARSPLQATETVSDRSHYISFIRSYLPLIQDR